MGKITKMILFILLVAMSLYLGWQPYSATETARSAANITNRDLSIVLVRPEPSSMCMSVVTSQPGTVYVEWWGTGADSRHKSSEYACSKTSPALIKMDGLTPGQQYSYQLYYKTGGESSFKTAGEYTYCTPKLPGTSFSFVVQSDSHLLNKADPALYKQSMETTASFKPDFFVDMGDAFLNDQVAKAQYQDPEKIRATYLQQRGYFDMVTRSAPLFQVVGNHEGEYGYYLDGSDKNISNVAAQMRKLYYPGPVPDQFYSGNTRNEPFIGAPEDYYAFTWGDALFVVIDPYRYCLVNPEQDRDGWQWSMGKEQYDWFRKTLENSTARYKFVFAHHANGNIRGGAAIARLYEWGGYDKKGVYLFDEERPGWGKPVHQVMKDTGVDVFFQGHAHLFAREVVDGVVYQTLPKPAERIPDKQPHDQAYSNCDKLLNSGILKVDVTPEQASISYQRNYFVSSNSQEGNTGIVYSYTIDGSGGIKVLKSVNDDFSTYLAAPCNDNKIKAVKK